MKSVKLPTFEDCYRAFAHCGPENTLDVPYYQRCGYVLLRLVQEKIEDAGKDASRLIGEKMAAQQQRDELLARVKTLEPAADCWNALASCYRLTFMGSAGCNPPSGKIEPGPAHITINLWTAPPGYADAERDQGQQDLLGRSQFGKFMDIALKNHAIAKASGSEG